MRCKELILETTETGCIVPTSHKLNQDGYFRYRRIGSVKGRSPLVMYHRIVYEDSYGEIPDGHEVDHKCRNRACCNLEHLQLLTISEHKAKTNKERSEDIKVPAKKYWQETGCTGTHLGNRFNVSFSAACKWVREWKV